MVECVRDSIRHNSLCIASRPLKHSDILTLLRLMRQSTLMHPHLTKVGARITQGVAHGEISYITVNDQLSGYCTEVEKLTSVLCEFR